MTKSNLNIKIPLQDNPECIRNTKNIKNIKSAKRNKKTKNKINKNLIDLYLMANSENQTRCKTNNFELINQIANDILTEINYDTNSESDDFVSDYVSVYNSE